MTANKNIGISWPASSFSGWGVYGLNLTLQLLNKGRNPVWISPPQQLNLDYKTKQRLKTVKQRQSDLSDLLGKIGVLEFDFPVLHSLRNDFKPALEDQAAHGTKNIGVMFFENTEFTTKGFERANQYDLIITGSTWNKDTLTSKGLTHVINIFQGIDDSLFFPIEKKKLYPGRFTIFSGGKLEYRKAQDVVISAFKKFQSIHKDALLICAWANQWPPIMKTIGNSKLIKGIPELGEDGQMKLSLWLENNDLPKDSFIDLGTPPNREIPTYLNSSDTAIFPNRCESGTNLVAMEAMAMGLPVILSSNTGHLNLINGFNCYPLLKQTPVEPYTPYAGVDGWAEPDLQEVIDHLESIYADRNEAAKRGQRAAKSLSKLTWENQIEKLLQCIDNLCND